MSRKPISLFVLLIVAAPHLAQARPTSSDSFRGQRTSNVVSALKRAGNSYGAAHRNERNLMRHQFYGRRDDPGYSVTGRKIVGQQNQARSDVRAAVTELRNRMQWISDPRERGRIESTISKVQSQMRNQDSNTRATTPYLNVGGARYSKTW